MATPSRAERGWLKRATVPMEGAGTRTGTGGLGAVDYLGLTMLGLRNSARADVRRIAGATATDDEQQRLSNFCSVTKARVSAGSRNPVFTVDLDEGRSEVWDRSPLARTVRAGDHCSVRWDVYKRLRMRDVRCQGREVIVVNERLRQAILDADCPWRTWPADRDRPQDCRAVGHRRPGLQALDDCRRGPLRVNPGPAEIGVSGVLFPRRGGRCCLDRTGAARLTSAPRTSRRSGADH